MAVMTGVGTWHELNGYRFRETLHGPMRWGVCVGCGKPALEMQPTGLDADAVTPDARCDACGRAHHGAALAYYETGKAEAYGTVTPFEPHRRDPEHGGKTTLKDFLDQVDDRWLPEDQRPTRCRLCAGVIDPIARTVEHPETHPTCDEGWQHLSENTPMETPIATVESGSAPNFSAQKNEGAA